MPTPDEMVAAVERLPPEKRAAAESLVAHLADSPIRPFLDKLVPHQILPRHVQPILNVFQAARFKRQFVLVEMPPRMAKTEAILRSLAWHLKVNPADTSGYTSYSDRRAWSKSEKARRYALKAGCHLNAVGSRSEWRTTEGGGLLATGAGGGLIGEGLQGWLVVDDPYKNRTQADSEVYTQTIREWFAEVAFTRSEGANILVQHHRWNPDDLIGWLLKEGKVDWTRIRLPALAEANDLLGRAIGDALWEGNPLWTKERLELIRSMIGEWAWAALYQQNPQPRGAKLFRDITVTFNLTEHLRNRRGWHRRIIGADPAASKKRRADHSVAVVADFNGGGPLLRARILDVYREHVTVPEFARALFQMSQRWMAPVYVEAVAGFKAVPDLLKEHAPTMPVSEAPVRGDKFLRAQGFAAAWNEGRVEVAEDAPWIQEFVAELVRFTGVEGGQDDQVDAGSHAWNAAAAEPDWTGMMRDLVSR